MEVVAADIGGTNARFAIAEIEQTDAGSRVTRLGEAVTLKAADYASLATAWSAFARQLGRDAPRGAGIAVASPITGDVLKMTNNPWMIRPASLTRELGLERLALVNDFEAVGHAVAQLPATEFSHIAGPDRALPEEGVISIVGPGTGLGVAHLLRRKGRYFVLPCEGGHVDFAPLDALEDAILVRLRQRFRRVSVERIVSGPGLANIHEALATIEGRPVLTGDDAALWTAALAGSDSLAAAALHRFCLSLGAIAGDIALVQGASAVVIGGGVGQRVAAALPGSGFADRFIAKGRFERMMAAIPVKLITHAQPGLFGAAAAYAEQHGHERL